MENDVRHYDGDIVRATEHARTDPDYIAYYQSRKDLFDDLRSAYAWWISVGRDPQAHSEALCFREIDGEQKYDAHKEEDLRAEATRMLGLVVMHRTHLWY